MLLLPPSPSPGSENTSLNLYFPSNHVVYRNKPRRGQNAEAENIPLPDFCFICPWFRFVFLDRAIRSILIFHDAMKPLPRHINTLTCREWLMSSAALTTYLLGDSWPPNSPFKGKPGCQFHEQHGENSIAQQGNRPETGKGTAEQSALTFATSSPHSFSDDIHSAPTCSCTSGYRTLTLKPELQGRMGWGEVGKSVPGL